MQTSLVCNDMCISVACNKIDQQFERKTGRFPIQIHILGIYRSIVVARVEQRLMVKECNKTTLMDGGDKFG